MQPTRSPFDCIGLMAAGWLLCAAGLAPAAAQGQESALTASAVSNRCLLVVETSRAMQRRVPNLLETTKSLLNSGLGDHLRPGDALGVWTFDEELVTNRFPLQVWAPENQLFSVRLLDFLQTQRYDRRASLQKLNPELARLVRASEFITIVLISTGDGEMRGTPFDDRINQAFKQWQSEQQKARMPLLVLLRGELGKWVDCSVTPAPWPLEMPPLPARLASRSAAANPTLPVVTAPGNPPPAAATNLNANSGETPKTVVTNSAPALVTGTNAAPMAIKPDPPATPLPKAVTNLNANSAETPKPVVTNPAPALVTSARTNAAPVAVKPETPATPRPAVQPTNTTPVRFSEAVSPPVKPVPTPAVTNASRAHLPKPEAPPPVARTGAVTSALPVTASAGAGEPKPVQAVSAPVPIVPPPALTKTDPAQPNQTTSAPIAVPKAAASVPAEMVKPELVQAAHVELPQRAVKPPRTSQTPPENQPQPIAPRPAPATTEAQTSPAARAPAPPPSGEEVRNGNSTGATSAPAETAPTRDTKALPTQAAVVSPPGNFFRDNAVWLGLMLLTFVVVCYFFVGWLASYRRPEVQLVTLPASDSRLPGISDQPVDPAAPIPEPAEAVSPDTPSPK